MTIATAEENVGRRTCIFIPPSALLGRLPGPLDTMRPYAFAEKHFVSSSLVRSCFSIWVWGSPHPVPSHCCGSVTSGWVCFPSMPSPNPLSCGRGPAPFPPHRSHSQGASCHTCAVVYGEVPDGSAELMTHLTQKRGTFNSWGTWQDRGELVARQGFCCRLLVQLILFFCLGLCIT